MPFLELFDETLDINSTENYELSIQASPDGFSFCLLDTIRNKYIMLRAFEPEESKYFNADMINEVISKDDFLTKRYKKINIVIPSQKFTLIPAPLYDPSKKDDYFNFNHNNDEGNTINTNKIPDPDSFLIFSMFRPISDLLQSYYPTVLAVHHMKPLLTLISHNRKSIHDNYIHIHVEREFFNLIIFNNNKLKFCNTYSYRNTLDILYFVLNVFKTLDLKQEETIYFSGMTGKYDDLSSIFSIYVRKIKFATLSGNFTFSYVFDDTDLHHYLNLFSITNCV